MIRAKVTRLFLRTTEFLWQEGHTAHETEEEAEAEARRMLGVYKEFLETELAVPVLDGRKTESEKFAGAAHTYSVEALMGDGRALQAGTSHHLGQELREGLRHHVPGAGQVRPVRLADLVGHDHPADRCCDHGPWRRQRPDPAAPDRPVPVVIVPIPRGDWRATVLPRAQDVAAALKRAGVRVMLDDREEYKPGWKFSEWEMRGVPLRLEIGPRDIEQQQVLVARRDTREKVTLPMEGLSERVSGLLDAVQTALLERAVAFRDSHTIRTASSDEFRRAFEGRPGFVIAPWCGSADCEAQIKAETQATIRNLAFDLPPATGACVRCGRPGLTDAYFAKSY